MLACATLKKGKTCIFMKRNGCNYNGGQCHPVVEACDGCSRVEAFSDGKFCQVFAEPALKWNARACNLASHVNNNQEKEGNAKKLNPLKASKRGSR